MPCWRLVWHLLGKEAEKKGEEAEEKEAEEKEAEEEEAEEEEAEEEEEDQEKGRGPETPETRSAFRFLDDKAGA